MSASLLDQPVAHDEVQRLVVIETEAMIAGRENGVDEIPIEYHLGRIDGAEVENIA